MKMAGNSADAEDSAIFGRCPVLSFQFYMVQIRLIQFMNRFFGTDRVIANCPGSCYYFTLREQGFLPFPAVFPVGRGYYIIRISACFQADKKGKYYGTKEKVRSERAPGDVSSFF